MKKFLLTLSVICLALTSGILFTACKDETPPSQMTFKQLAYYEEGYYENNDATCIYYEATSTAVKGLITVKNADGSYKLTSYAKTDMKMDKFTLLEDKTYAGISYNSSNNVYVYKTTSVNYVIVEECEYPSFEQETLVNFFSANRTNEIKCTNVSAAAQSYAIDEVLTLNPTSLTVGDIHTEGESESYTYKKYNKETNEYEFTLDSDETYSIFVKVSGVNLLVRDSSANGVVYTFK